jgi:hypothetical protein
MLPARLPALRVPEPKFLTRLDERDARPGEHRCGLSVCRRLAGHARINIPAAFLADAKSLAHLKNPSE